MNRDSKTLDLDGALDALSAPIVTGAPPSIYLVYGDIERDCTHKECDEAEAVTWCSDRQFDSDVEYVRADLLDKMDDRIRRIKFALHEIADEWVAARCGEPATAQEAYTIELARRMYSLAIKAFPI
jgi:hypothetical protein